MKAEQIIGLKVIEVAHGTNVGTVAGLLIDADEKRAAAVAVSGSGLFKHTRYIPIKNIISIENDVVTIPSVESLLDRKNLPQSGTLDSLTGRKVLTEDGKELGEVRSYGIDPGTGDINYITFGVNKQVLGGLWKSAGDSYDIQRTHIKTLGQNVLVDNSVPDIVGLNRAA